MEENDNDKEKEDKEQRRQRAIKTGKRFESIVCPMCLRTRVGRVWDGEQVFKSDKDNNPEVIQVRYSLGGRGCGGFFKNEKESIRMDILKQKEPEVWKSLKISVNTISKMFEGE